MPVEFLDFALEVAQPGAGALEALVGAHDADVVPHEAADLVPVVIDHDEFVHIQGIAGAPFRDDDVDAVFADGDATDDVHGGAMAEDCGFQKGIAGEAIGTMEAGTGDFADCVQAAQAGAAIDGGLHAAALVMGSRDYGDGLPGDIDAEVHAGLVDIREAVADEISGHVGDIEEDAAFAGPFHLGVDGARHDVARGELLERVIALHESAAPGIE